MSTAQAIALVIVVAFVALLLIPSLPGYRPSNPAPSELRVYTDSKYAASGVNYGADRNSGGLPPP